MYKKLEVSFDKVPQLSERDKAYQRADPALKPFYKHEVNLASFEMITGEKAKYPVDRELLVEELTKQYSELETSDSTRQNIDSLGNSHTFTVITAHQPSLLTGPLYFIYKICSAISLSNSLNSESKNFKTVPVFVIGGEDHDFDEIATLRLFGNEYTWKTDQIGPTGRMSLEGIDDVLNQVFERFGEGGHAISLRDKITRARTSSSSYGRFMTKLVNDLFKDYGLVIVNMDNQAFKKRFLPFAIRDVEHRDSFHMVHKDQEGLEKAGFKDQAYAREVNFFWMDGDRHRIIDVQDGTYRIDETIYSTESLIELLKSNPGAISPNVILRPLYQEVIMPNLAYIGGGGEIAYWLERKSLFESWEIPFPMLVRRDSVMIMDKRSVKWLETANMTILDLFEREEQIIGKYAHQQAPVDIDLAKEKMSIHDVFEEVKALAAKIDPTLQKTVISEEVKAKKSLDYLESKLLKAEKNKNEVGVNKLSKMKHKFFPGNDGLQERHDNFIQFYLRYGQSWIDELLSHLDPLNKNFKILIEE